MRSSTTGLHRSGDLEHAAIRSKLAAFWFPQNRQTRRANALHDYRYVLNAASEAFQTHFTDVAALGITSGLCHPVADAKSHTSCLLDQDPCNRSLPRSGRRACLRAAGAYEVALI